jgi:hypothetical protein
MSVQQESKKVRCRSLSAKEYKSVRQKMLETLIIPVCDRKPVHTKVGFRLILAV